VKNRDLLGSIESINAIAALKQPVRTAFAVALNLKAVKDHMEVFDGQRKKIVEAHTKKDEAGVAIPVYEAEKGEDGKPLLDKDGEPILIYKDELTPEGEPKTKDGKPVRKLVNKVIEGQVKLDDPKAFQKEINDLLDIDVADELKIRPVKLSDLKGDIESQHFANAIWMINDDVSDKAEPAAADKK
jgi:hypothetical protein